MFVLQTARLCDLQWSHRIAHQVAASVAGWKLQRLWDWKGRLPALLLLVFHPKPYVKSFHLPETQVHIPVEQPGLKPRFWDPSPALSPFPRPTLLFSDLRDYPSCHLYGTLMRTGGGKSGRTF